MNLLLLGAELQQFSVSRQALARDFRYCKMHQNDPNRSPPPRPPSTQGSDEGDPKERPLYSQQLKIIIQKPERLNRNVLEFNFKKKEILKL